MSKMTEDEYKELRDEADKISNLFDGKTPKQKMIIRGMFLADLKRSVANDMNDKEQAITWGIANTAYQYILDDNVTAKEALTLSAQDHEAELEKVLGEKSRYTGKMSNTIVKSNDEHPIQKDMKKRGKFNKQAINNSDTVWQMLNLLKDFREAYEDFLKLEEALKRINKLDGKVLVLEDEVEQLQAYLGMKSMSDKDKAALMKSKGFNQKDVAGALGKGVRTINRWWPDL